ncbi:alpha/beta hydrolase [Streptomyces sp. NPDC017988]|uniref:alpha/beta hydrolase n=1 Tax=Streptomyces sp. NPDC017988 TaxID=3365025 RepID=UPI0037941931
MVGVDGGGHGVYVLGNNSCALNTATRYLVEGEMPAKDTSCRADRPSPDAVNVGRPYRTEVRADAASRRPGPDCRDR